MDNFTKEDLEEARRALASLLHKCEKTGESAKLGPSQRTLLKNRIAALRVALSLIDEAITEK